MSARMEEEEAATVACGRSRTRWFGAAKCFISSFRRELMLMIPSSHVRASMPARLVGGKVYFRPDV